MKTILTTITSTFTNKVMNTFTNKKVVVAIKILFIVVFLLISLCNGDVDGVLRAITAIVLD